MYEMQLFATDDADWAVRIELTDDDTGLALDTTDIQFDLNVEDCGSSVLSASTTDATIEVPETGTFQWRFTAAQMASLCPGRTYKVGCTMTTAGGTTQLFIGSLAILDGNF